MIHFDIFEFEIDESLHPKARQVIEERFNYDFILLKPLNKIGDSTVRGLHPIVSHKIIYRDAYQV